MIAPALDAWGRRPDPPLHANVYTYGLTRSAITNRNASLGQNVCR